ncbi:DUF4167 domain-containing protein [Acidocella sp.]|uniref:DUF4167 domain-containing protein n=1 Tax=Acidocella sp. TaxID=50710 RepID=UPI0038D1DFB8
MKRMRGRNHRPNGGGGGGGGGGGFRNQQNGIPLNRNHVFDSSGPEMRVRGTAQQLYDKYQQMARDASSNGDRVTGEAYYQHAEHYFRIISAINQAQGLQNPPAGQQNAPQERGFGGQANSHSAEQRREPQTDLLEAGETRPQEPRPPQEFRADNRDNREPRENREPRRFEQRGFEPRQRPERPERNEPRFRPENVVDARIDISSALEAELAAATAEPAGLGEQPSLPGTLAAPAPAPAPEAPRAIPIMRNAPPAEAAPEAAPPPAAAAVPETPAPRVPRPRGRPRIVRPEPEAVKAEE